LRGDLLPNCFIAYGSPHQGYIYCFGRGEKWRSEMSSKGLSSSGIPLKVFYTEDDLKGNKIEDPGRFPFARGIYSEGYRAMPWIESFASGYGLPEETNEREHYLRDIGHKGFKGLDSINLVFDRPTFLGYDSDDPRVTPDVGHIGVIIDTVDDMERLFKGFDLSSLNVGFIVDTQAPALMALYVALADRWGVPRKALNGILCNNPCEAYFVARMRTMPPRPALRMVADVAKFCIKEIPGFNICRINGYNVEESGANPVQEVAFALAPAIAIMQEAVDRGLNPDEMASRINFQFGQGRHFFEHICKIRAARRMWANILKERFKVRKDTSCRMKIHMQTAGWTLTAQGPLNNIIRITLQSLGAVLSGTQSVHIAAYDEALGLPTEDSVRVAVNTSKILQHETGLCDVADPLGGSYYVESLTDDIEEKVWEHIHNIDKLGGFVRAVEDGYLEKHVVSESYSFQQKLKIKEEIIVGINEFIADDEGGDLSVFGVNEKAAEVAVKRLKEYKQHRDQRDVNAALEAVKEAAADNSKDVMPLLVEAASRSATIGEMNGALMEVFGDYQPRTFLA
jgi:methylmalonyl-CoA mutase N-terminal domain/subunit